MPAILILMLSIDFAKASNVPNKTANYGHIQKISKTKSTLKGKKRYLIVRAK